VAAKPTPVPAPTIASAAAATIELLECHFIATPSVDDEQTFVPAGVSQVRAD
jgi:hypothetical protein